MDADPKDNESLADARRQALYQITRDPALLRPFFDQLKSADPKERDRGLAAFGLLKLTVAPREVVKALRDSNIGNRCSAAMVLGEIGDPTTVEPLIGAATDAKMDRSVRCDAIWALGEMRAGAAADSMERLLTNPDVSASAAIALYRITGRKVKQFPEGYNAD